MKLIFPSLNLFFLARITLLGKQDGTKDGTNHVGRVRSHFGVLEQVRDSPEVSASVVGQSQHGVAAGSTSHPLGWEVPSPAQRLLLTVPDSKYLCTCDKHSPVTQGGRIQLGDRLQRSCLLTPSACCFKIERSCGESKRDVGNMETSHVLQFLVLPCKPPSHTAGNISQ